MLLACSLVQLPQIAGLLHHASLSSGLARMQRFWADLDLVLIVAADQ